MPVDGKGQYLAASPLELQEVLPVVRHDQVADVEHPRVGHGRRQGGVRFEKLAAEFR